VKPMGPPGCHPEREHEARGLCRPCYQREYRRLPGSQARTSARNRTRWKNDPDYRARSAARGRLYKSRPDVKEALRLYQAAYCAANAGRISARMREYRQAHREEISQRERQARARLTVEQRLRVTANQRRYTAAKRERIVKRTAAYRAANRERQHTYEKANRERANARRRRRLEDPARRREHLAQGRADWMRRTLDKKPPELRPAYESLIKVRAWLRQRRKAESNVQAQA
jgi:hypothetical protein